MNRLINQILKTALSELFIDALKDTVHLSLGDDLFSSSKIHLQNLTLRADIFDSVFYPFQLLSGYLGNLTIEGLAEIALGRGNIKISIENIFLLFSPQFQSNISEINVLYIQILKKIYLELLSNAISHALIKNMLKKLLGMKINQNLKTSHQRKLIYLSIKYIFKMIQINIKKIHIRVEFKTVTKSLVSSETITSWSAVGITLPMLKIGQNLTLTNLKSNMIMDDENDPFLALILKSLQVYCDYDCTPYCPPQDLTPAQQRAAILKRFTEGWSTEIHTALLLPFDMEVLCSVSVEVLSGRLAPKLTVAIPHIRMALDPLQLTVFKDLLEAITTLIKRSSTLYRVKGIFTELDPPPRVKSEGGIHILPQLWIGRSNLNFPGDISIPKDQCNGVIGLLKVRCASDIEMGSWAKHMWKFAIDMVLNDLRQHLPYGRWRNLILLCWSRKEYAFLYGKYLRHKRILETKQKIPSPLSAADIIRLFEYEMKYPISIILQFREVAFAVFYAQELFQRKKNAANKSMASSNQGSSRRLSSAAPPRASLTGSGSTGNPLNSLDFQQAMSWSHVLHMITILRDEQKGIATEVSHNEDEGLNIIAPALSTVATSNLKSSSEDSIRKNFESKKDESKVKDEPKVETPVKTPVQETPTTPSEDPPVKSDDSKRVEGQDGKKISLGISLKKGGPPVEMSVPILKTSSKTASSLFSSMKQGLEQLGLDSGNRDRDMDQSRSTPSKKTPIVEPENKPVVISQELFSEEQEVRQASSRASIVGDINRFNNLFAKSINFLQDKEGETSDNGSDSDEDWEQSTEVEYDATNNIHANYAAIIDAARWVIRMHQSPISVLLPNAQLTLNKIELSIRLPVENRFRRPLISMEILNTSILLSASSTTNQQHAVEEDSKAKGVLLAGFLIILKLSIQSLVIKLHKRKILENSEGESKDSDILVPVLSSSNEDHFINACILVDIPPGTGEGDQAASDVQISLSALDVILKKDLIALLVEPKVRAYLAQTLYCFRKMLINVGVLLDESLIVEHSHDCFGVPSVMLRNLRAKMTASSFALEEDPSGSMDRHKQAVASYLNTSRYYKIFCSILPKGVLSFALRMSFIHANLLSSTSIKSFLIISMQDLFDRALSDPNSTQSLYSRNALNAYLKQAAKKTIRKSTKIGQRMSNSMFSGKPGVKTSAMAKLDPISVEIKKATDPIPLITLNCAGFNLSLPIDDDTICRGLAIVMNQILPFYSIHTAPPPEVSLGDSDEEEDEEAHKEVSPAIEAPISDPQHTKLEEAAPSVPMQETSGYGLLLESKLAYSKCPINTWRVCDFSSFEVRIDNGLFKKEKRPSARPLYNPVCVYAYKVRHQIAHIASIMPTPLEFHRVEEITSKGIFIPPVFVVQIHVPSPNNVMHMKRDGPGVTFVMYFTLSKSALKELEDMSLASPALKLFNEYCKHSYKDHSWQSRMKAAVYHLFDPSLLSDDYLIDSTRTLRNSPTVGPIS